MYSTYSEENINFKKVNKNTKLKKFLTILTMSLILLIPNAFISNIISDRMQYKLKAVENIANSWATAQIIQAPTMNISGKELKLNNYEALINIKTETRKKGVFKIPVYIAEVTQKGTFDNEHKTLKNTALTIKISISDPRGYIDEPQFNINNQGFKNSKDTIFVSNLTTNLNNIPFEIKYKIKGINDISVIPEGKTNKISISGDWKDPSFSGDFLPIEREITNNGFSAKWNIPKIAISESNAKINTSLLILDDNYSLAQKTSKYAFLLLSLIFTGYFIFEITSKESKKIHPIQYCLLGITLLLFYLLLTSMSEIISFNFAYLISALMVTGLIFIYTYFVITKKKNIKFATGISISIISLYFFFFILLKLQDAALLSGSLGLFIVIALTMYLTRNVDWYNEKEE